MENEGESKNESRLVRLQRWVAIAEILAVCLITVCIIVCLIVFNYNLTYTVTDLTEEDAVKTELLSVGLAIIALAVAVWSGLNIVNAIDRQTINKYLKGTDLEVTRLNGRLKEIDDSLGGFSGEIASWKNQANEQKEWIEILSKKPAFELFLRELYGKAEDGAEFFYTELSKLIGDKEVGSDICEPLLIIEQHHKFITSRHRGDGRQDSMLVQEAEEEIDIIKKTKEKLERNKRKEGAKENLWLMIELYLISREAFSYFFIGYARGHKDEDKHKSIKDLTQAAGLFEKVIVVADKLDHKVKESEKYKRFEFTAKHSQGEVLSRQVYLYGKLAENNATTRNDESTRKKALSLGKKAITIFEEAVKENAPLVGNLEKAYRNYGCAHERIGRFLSTILFDGKCSLVKVSNEKQKKYYPKIMNSYDLAKEQYREALRISMEDDRTPRGQVRNSYHVRLSWYDQHLQLLCGRAPLCLDAHVKKRYDNEWRKAFGRCVDEQEISEKMKKAIEEFNALAEASVKDFPQERFHYGMLMSARIWDVTYKALSLKEEETQEGISSVCKVMNVYNALGFSPLNDNVYKATIAWVNARCKS